MRKLQLFILLAVLLGSCGVPIPVIDTDYKDDIYSFSYFLRNDTMYIFGGHHSKSIFKHLEWDFWSGYNWFHTTVEKPNKYVYKTSDTELIFELQKSSYGHRLTIKDPRIMRIRKFNKPEVNGAAKYMIEHDGNIYWVAGEKPSFEDNSAVWRCNENFEWEQLIEYPKFLIDGKRLSHLLCTHKGYIVLAGGRHSLKVENAIWISTNGIDWKKTYDFGEDADIKNIFSFNDRLLVLTEERNDYTLHFSDDFYSWNQYPDVTNNAYGGEYDFFAFHDSLYAATSCGIFQYQNDSSWLELFNETYFKSELFYYRDTLFNELIDSLAYTHDLKTWYRYSTHKPILTTKGDSSLYDNYDFRNNYQIIEHRDTLFMVTGEAGITHYSIDAINWNKYKKQINFPGIRIDYSTCSFNNAIWIFGGITKEKEKAYTQNYLMLNDIWYTHDGARWQKLPNVNWQARSKVLPVPYKTELYLLGGGAYCYNFSEIWKINKELELSKVRNYPSFDSSTGVSIRPGFMNAVPSGNGIYLLDAYVGSGFYTFNPNGKSYFTKYNQNEYYVPDLENTVQYIHRNNKKIYVAKQRQYLYYSNDFISWKPTEYSIISHNYSTKPYDATLVSYKNKLYLVEKTNNEIRSCRIMLDM
jgi:hypothetical protein